MARNVVTDEHYDITAMLTFDYFNCLMSLLLHFFPLDFCDNFLRIDMNSCNVSFL